MLAARLLKLLAERDLQLLTLESCSGGRLAARLTAIAGASSNYLGGHVCYANSMKQSLGVSPETLCRHGAVSAETITELLQAGLNTTKADMAIAISGVAGPGGGSASKPVGCVYLGWQLRGQQALIQRQQLTGDREHIQAACADIALTQACEILGDRVSYPPHKE